ncbi:MAG: GntR family transcriptional regulator [bacterium]|nr:GntR family transcriptional regulator [bacterium]
MEFARILGAAKIARNGALPAYYQIESSIRAAIEKGTLAPGDELPSEQEMAESFKVNRLTVRRALQELVSKGLVQRSQGRRSRVAMRKIPLDPFGSFAVQVARHGQAAGTVVHACALDTAPRDIRKALYLETRRRVLHIERTRTLDAMPVAVEDNYLRAEFAVPFIEKPSRAEHLYDSLRDHCHLPIWDVNADVEMRSADDIEAAHLDVREGHPLFALRLTLSRQNEPFGYTYVRFLADRFHFHLGLQRYPLSIS